MFRSLFISNLPATGLTSSVTALAALYAPGYGEHIFHVEFLSLLVENQFISKQFYTLLIGEVLHLQKM
jgi:hypothetical protein